MPFSEFIESFDKVLKLEKSVEPSRNSLINGNLKFAVYYAKRFRSSDGPNFLDLIQECNKALVAAVDYFDGKKSNIRTYAKQHMKARILELFRRNNKVHTNSRSYWDYWKLRKILNENPELKERNLLPEDIAKSLDCSDRQAKRILLASLASHTLPLETQNPDDRRNILN